jgi:hypothetical protein
VSGGAERCQASIAIDHFTGRVACDSAEWIIVTIILSVPHTASTTALWLRPWRSEDLPTLEGLRV